MYIDFRFTLKHRTSFQGHVKRPRPYMEREDQALSREQETEQPPENNHDIVRAADSGVVAANETGPPQRSPNTRNEGWWHYITDCVVAKWIPPAPFCMCGARQDCSRPPSELPGELPVSSAISETPQVGETYPGTVAACDEFYYFTFETEV